MDDTRPPAPSELAASFKALGDPTRLAVLERLMQGVQCNCEIGESLGLPMNLISHHLKVLRKAGLVNGQRDPVDARWIYYSINLDALALLQRGLCAFLDPKRVQARQPTCGPRVACER
jgi:ArsR family transcriptional regulator